MKPHRGATVLTLGILGLVTCPICGLIAWIMASDDLQEMDSGRMDYSGRDLTNAGRICGIIGTVILGIWVLMMVFVGLTMLAAN